MVQRLESPVVKEMLRILPEHIIPLRKLYVIKIRASEYSFLSSASTDDEYKAKMSWPGFLLVTVF